VRNRGIGNPGPEILILNYRLPDYEVTRLVMPRKRVRSLRCPTCKKIVLRDEPDFPFCSDRCRLIDLGKWASGAYVISSPISDPENANLEYSPDGEYREPGPTGESDDAGHKRRH